VRLLPFEADWVRAIARALMPPGTLGGVLDGIDTGARFDREMARSPWYAALGMRVSLWLTWLAPVWMLGHAQTFGAVDDTLKVEILEKLLKHPRYELRMAAMFLKLTLCTLALGDERVLRALGAYDLERLPSSSSARSAS
jgi:hypothetical protein